MVSEQYADSRVTRSTRPSSMLDPPAFLRSLHDNLTSAWPDDAYAAAVTRVRVGNLRLFTANTPTLVRHVLVDHVERYPKSVVARRLFERALGQGLLTSDGLVWKKHRQVVAPMFVHRRMAALVPAMVDEVERHLERWKTGVGFELTEMLSTLALSVITRTMFGAESHPDALAIADYTQAYQRLIGTSLVPGPNTEQIDAIAEGLTQTIYRVIARRRQSSTDHDDLLAALLRSYDQHLLSQQEVRDEIATIFTAGHETTAAAMAWALYCLDRHPEIEARLISEVRQVLGQHPPTAENLEELRFTRMVVEESLRLYPPAHSLIRTATCDDHLGDTPVPKGAIVLVSPWLLHRNPTVWSHPDHFDPDRFEPRLASERHRYSYIPFGTGPRVCVGASFAMMETVLMLAIMLQRWHVRLDPAHPVEPLARITIRPRWGLRATAEPRGRT